MEDPQDAYTTFLRDFTAHYDTCFPIKVVKHGYRNRKPWLTDGLKKSIKNKNKLFRRCKKTKYTQHELEYKRYRNKLHGLLLKAEKDHYDKLLEDNKNNLKKSW